jgi:methanogenic corrinoid protein MtbC1
MKGQTMDQYAEQFEQALLSLDRLAARNLLEQSREAYQWTPEQFIDTMIVSSLERIGNGWERGEIALSQVYMSGRICEELIDSILPPGDPKRKHQPRMAITVLEDYHMLGKRIVYSILRANGFELTDYGRTAADELISRVRNDGIEILLISVLMLPSALKVKDVRLGLNQNGTDVKIIVGGAPFLFDDALWKETHADAMGKNPSEALTLIHQMTEERS